MNTDFISEGSLQGTPYSDANEEIDIMRDREIDSDPFSNEIFERGESHE